MSANVFRAARAGLGWSQADLAAEAGVHLKSVAYWEDRDPSKSKRSRIVPAMREAFARHGVVITGHAVIFSADS